ncbi:hypothetical protein ABB37_08989 [Leptomonas pyrrhocoris]|uniref:RING-type domain-containing protein n=1 Tax=Leptomonas pyrrhocoris TaxID=157538 RepID=A0A0M9FRN0_LEPPY|nr:hypothetical protein ABB37_08989 [Leptomonas pyrrhocoris]KPA74655.1 hypothetical protein ABB37_08989 [Leptomonas pyrrhocoris]|eukprot:XP_015653094.1 hypothetical protein ABB37_08989 [Leptomonas pyrrhocoris]
MTSRKQSWTEICPDRIQKRISACTSTGLKLESENDPTKFIVIDRNGKRFRCTVGNPHRCSCSSSQPCVHVLFSLVSFFKVAPTNASLWQKGVSELELSEWIAGRIEKEKCLFCRETVTEEGPCERCGTRFHKRCLQLASTAGKCQINACPRCTAELSIEGNCSSLRCESCHRACRDDHYRCLLCDYVLLCPECYRSSNTHPSHPFAHRNANSSVPFSPASDPVSVEEMQYREINPEDYEVLISLDSGNNKRLSPHVLSSLPLVEYDTSDSCNQCCPICQHNFSTRDLCLVLPCGHIMHRECGRRWLSQYSDECPIDHLVVKHSYYTNRANSSMEKYAKNEETRNRSATQQQSNLNKFFLPPIRPTR